jgi:hypothetical protein
MKLKRRECDIRLCATPCFEVHHTKLHFWRPTDTKVERQNTQMYVHITTVITELLFFSSIFLTERWWWRGCGFYRKDLCRNRDLSEDPLCVCLYLLHFANMRKRELLLGDDSK